MTNNYPFRLTLALLLCLAFSSIKAQQKNIPVGTWRTHLPYTTITTVEQTKDKIYAASRFSFFYFDKEDNSLNTLSRINGFSDTEINKLKYYAPLNVMLIAYANGNIDLLSDNKITNVNDIFRATSIAGSKRINHINFHKDMAYLSCDFGVVVLDLKKKEIRSSYINIHENAAQREVYSSAIINDSLYITTSTTVRAGVVTANLEDYRRWITINNNLIGGNSYLVSNFDNRLVAAVDNKGIFWYDNGNWTNTNVLLDAAVQSINSKSDQLVISTLTSVILLDKSFQAASVISNNELRPSEAIIDETGKVWVADRAGGLIAIQNGESEKFQPNGPLSESTVKLHIHQNKIVALPGGIASQNAARNNTGFYVFGEDGWSNYGPTQDNVDGIYFEDAMAAATAPDGSLFIGTFGYGLVKWAPDGTFSIINEATPGVSLINIYPGSPYLRVPALTSDRQGNLWISNYASTTENNFSQKLHSRSPDDKWKAYSFDNSRIPSNGIRRILIDDNNYKWLSIFGAHGILVFDELTGKTRKLTNNTGEGNLPSGIVNDIALDKNGEIWVGTESGVAVFYSPGRVFENEAFNANIPIFKINDTQGTPLLQGEVINCITVDGANRKWIGTTKGIYFVNPDGTELVNYFFTGNSPLISDFVRDIAIHPVTGEVFIATDRGIVSYRGTATEATEVFSEVKVFPNPVRPDFTGDVAISGLAANANVKITDIDGKLVFQMQATGGTATWNKRDYNGKKAKSGVYMVYSATEEGTEGYVTKFAVIE